jgi:NurA-like 5'-3' nuclease
MSIKEIITDLISEGEITQDGKSPLYTERATRLICSYIWSIEPYDKKIKAFDAALYEASSEAMSLLDFARIAKRDIDYVHLGKHFADNCGEHLDDKVMSDLLYDHIKVDEIMELIEKHQATDAYTNEYERDYDNMRNDNCRGGM